MHEHVAAQVTALSRQRWLQVLQNDVTTADYELLQRLRALRDKVAGAAQSVKADEEMAEHAPDEFKAGSCICWALPNGAQLGSMGSCWPPAWPLLRE